MKFTHRNTHTYSSWKVWIGLLALPFILASTCEDGAQEAPDDATPQDMHTQEDMNAMTDGGVPSDEMMSDMSEMPEEEDMFSLPLTYYKDIKPLMHSNCETCHRPGDIGPYPLETYENVKQHAQMALGSMRSGSMPPWSPDPECRHYKGERLMSAEDIATFAAWVEQGMEKGEESDWVLPEQEGGESMMPDLIGRQNGAYTPTPPPRTDDYQCYVIDLEFDEDTYVTGTTVVPGNRELVHHANLFLVNPTHAPLVNEIQDRDPDPGYECFGNAGINQTNLVGAWVPGAQPIFMPEDAAIIVQKGSKLVLQVHYNSQYTDPAPVESEVHLFTRPTPPSKQISAMPIANLTFEVPAGEKESVHKIKVRNSTDKPWKVIGTGPHLHLLASAVKVEVIRQNDEEPNVCLVDIPDWDFNWQQEYRFRDDEWVDVNPRDSIELTCVFDNSPENQPVIDGERQQPRAIDWGEKSSDEMCLNFLVVMQDYDPTKVNGPLCSEFKECRPDCDDPNSVGCIFNCAAQEQTCGECLLFGAQDCAGRYCSRQLGPAIPCLLTCAQGAQGGGDIASCLEMECPAEYAELSDCMTPYIEQGLCNQYVEECNVEF